MSARLIIEPFQLLLDRMATIKLLMRLSSESTKKSLEYLQSQKSAIEKFNEKDADLFGHRYDSVFFSNPYTGKLQPIKAKKTSIDEWMLEVYFGKNRQYQCALSDAYELFEDFLVAVYQVCRATDPAFRIKSDKGEAGSRELKKHATAVRSKIREKVPVIKEVEIRNELNRNYRLHVTMTERFRHIIVHKNGQVENVRDFIEKVLKKANLASDKARRPEAESIILQHIANSPYEGLVLLVEQPRLIIEGFNAFINPCDHLIDVLIGYALIASKSIIEHFEFEVSDEELNQLSLTEVSARGVQNG